MIPATATALMNRLLRDESGQAMTEYASITMLLLVAGLALGASWPFTKVLFEGLQTYLDLYYLALNLAGG